MSASAPRGQARPPPSPPPFQAILFDMDGLLVDSEPLWRAVLADFVAERGGGLWTAEHARSCTGKGFSLTLQFMSDTFGFHVDVARDAATILDRVIARVGEVMLKPGAREILAAARASSCRAALASSSQSRLVSAALSHFDLASYFDVVVAGDMVARTKPEPDIFLRAADELRAPPGACVVLEDSLAGVTAGRAAGMIVVAIPEGPPDGRGYEALADVVLPDLWAARAWLGLSERPVSASEREEQRRSSASDPGRSTPD